MRQRLKNTSLVRFIMTGGINTMIDAVIFVTLRSLGAAVVTGNIFSTSIALCVGYVLNSRYTFSLHTMTKQRIVLYFAVTLVGLWVIQPIIITAMIMIHAYVPYTQLLVHLVGNETLLLNIVPKLTATIFTMVWNYLWYKKVVFAPRMSSSFR